VGNATKRFVYIIRSLADGRPYIGLTSDVSARLAPHNAGHSAYTARYKPWQLVVSIEFADESTAVRFDRYLKSGSGHAFTKRHFRPNRDENSAA
jgi:putative endonuclease